LLESLPSGDSSVEPISTEQVEQEKGDANKTNKTNPKISPFMSFFGHLEPMVGAAGPAITGHTRLEMPQRPPPATAGHRRPPPATAGHRL